MSPPSGTGTRRLGPVASGVAVSAITAVSWLLVASRAIPGRDGDRGVFASMAERVAAGDRLYVDVWDNKDPLFYLTLGLGRFVSPYFDVIIELGWLVAGAAASYALMRAHAINRPLAILVGWALTPLVLTGGAYLAGFTHLPGTVLLLVAYALLVRGRPVLSGALLPVLAGFKLVMLPLLVVAVLLELRHATASAKRSYALGTAVSAVVLTVLLAVRGELIGFLTLIVSNVSYSQSGLYDAYQWPVWKHLEPVFQSASVVTLAAIVLVLALVRVLPDSESSPRLWSVTLGTTLAAIVVIAVTGMWPHHGQILYGPAVLALVLAVSTLPGLRILTWTSLITTTALAVLLAGGFSLRAEADSLLSASSRWQALGTTAASTLSLTEIAPPGSSYARLGRNTDDSHAQGLWDYALACHQFVQFPYDQPTRLEAIATCLPTADFVIVDPSLSPEPGWEEWNRFVDDAEATLAKDFTCTGYDWGRLCVNSTNAASDT